MICRAPSAGYWKVGLTVAGLSWHGEEWQALRKDDFQSGQHWEILSREFPAGGYLAWFEAAEREDTPMFGMALPPHCSTYRNITTTTQPPHDCQTPRTEIRSTDAFNTLLALEAGPEGCQWEPKHIPPQQSAGSSPTLLSRLSTQCKQLCLPAHSAALRWAACSEHLQTLQGGLVRNLCSGISWFLTTVLQIPAR